MTESQAHRVTVTTADDGVVMAMWPEAGVSDAWPLAFRRMTHSEVLVLMSKLQSTLRPTAPRPLPNWQI